MHAYVNVCADVCLLTSLEPNVYACVKFMNINVCMDRSVQNKRYTCYTIGSLHDIGRDFHARVLPLAELRVFHHGPLVASASTVLDMHVIVGVFGKRRCQLLILPTCCMSARIHCSWWHLSAVDAYFEENMRLFSSMRLRQGEYALYISS